LPDNNGTETNEREEKIGELVKGIDYNLPLFPTKQEVNSVWTQFMMKGIKTFSDYA
jgi:hypothetical protein